MYNFEEKETYSLEEVKDIVNGIKTNVDTTIEDLQEQVKDFEELGKQNHQLQVQNLAIKNGLDEDMLDLVYDEDIEKVESKIEKLKEVTKEKQIGNSYKPERKRNDDAYEKAINNNDVEGALKSKLGKLFE